MRKKYLGDSYDALKRLWYDLLFEWAPLYANPQFIPYDLQAEFKTLTKISMLSEHHPLNFSILNDPDTGIRLPGTANQKEGRTHIAIDSIINQLNSFKPQCIITYDQSNYRNSGMGLAEQRKTKMEEVSLNGYQSFYYVSHAPFLFTTLDKQSLSEIQSILAKSGIPDNRFEYC